MSTLALAALMTLATAPGCGAAPVGSDMAMRLQAIAVHESGDQRSYADPLLIGVNADAAAGLPHAVVRPASAGDAVARARALIAQGRSIDLGLMQINSASLARDGLSVETAFDACANMAAGARHFAADLHAVLDAAHRRYNTGSTERGAGYAAAVEAVLTRIQATGLVASLPLAPAAPPPCAPEWDAWALAECSVRPLPATPPADGASSAPITTAAKEPSSGH